MKQENTTEQLLAEIESLHKRVDELKETEFMRKETEGALKESEARYRSLYEKMINGFTYQKIIVDKNNRPVDYLLLEVNESFRMQTGVNYDDIINKKATDIFPGIEKSKFDWIGTFGKVALTGEEIRFEGYLEPLQRWYEVFAYRPENGYFIAIYNEITERKQAEKDLRQREEQLQHITDNMLDMITQTDRRGVIQYLSPSYGSVLGYKPDELLGKSTCDYIYPDDRKRAIDAFQKGINTCSTGRLEYRFRHSDGHYLWMETFGKPLLDDNDMVTGAILASRDITGRKKIEKKLIESYCQLEKNLVQTVQSLSSLAEMRDPYIAGHQVRVANIACAIASEMGLMKNAIGILRTAALVHDIGKTTIPTEILNKPGSLTDIERVFIQTHAQASYEVLKTIEFGCPIAEIVQQHHERLDGSGYPGGLTKSSILFAARILAVADVIEAMASHRPYRPALPIEQAIDEIRCNRGRLYDPEVVDACLSLFETNNYQFSSPAHYS